MSNFEIQYRGVEHEQSWMGAGVALSEFDYCVTGVGESEQDALQDAIEQAAQLDCPQDILDECELEVATADQTIEGDDEMHHYVVIRWTD